MQALGLAEQIFQTGQRIDRLLGRSAPSNRRVLNVNYAALGDAHFGIAIHRGALFKALFDAVTARDIALHTGIEVTDIPGLESYDLIVDASGARSKLHHLSQQTIRHTSLDYGAIWGSFEWPGKPFSATQLEQRYVAAHTMIGVLPLGRSFDDAVERVAFFWSMRIDQYEPWLAAGLDDWKSRVRKIWPETTAILDQISTHEQLNMVKYGHHTLRQPYTDRLVFVGDSAHATSPQLGQGANMALLDAWALGNAIQQTDDLPAALAYYAKTRRWHVRGFQAASLLLTPFYQSDSKLLAMIRDSSFDTISRLPVGRRLVAGLVSGMLGDPFGKVGLSTTDSTLETN